MEDFEESLKLALALEAEEAELQRQEAEDARLARELSEALNGEGQTEEPALVQDNFAQDKALAEKIALELELEDLRERLEREEEDFYFAKELELVLNTPKEELARTDLEIARLLQTEALRYSAKSYADITKMHTPSMIVTTDYNKSQVSYSQGTTELLNEKRKERQTILARMTAEQLMQELHDCEHATFSEAVQLRNEAFGMCNLLGTIDRSQVPVLQRKIARANIKAAGIIFWRTNSELCKIVLRDMSSRAPCRLSRGENMQVDLHFLLVEEALDRLAAVLDVGTRSHWGGLTVICGAGKHSANKRQRLAPSARRFLESMQQQGSIKRVTDKGDGVFHVVLL